MIIGGKLEVGAMYYDVFLENYIVVIQYHEGCRAYSVFNLNDKCFDAYTDKYIEHLRML